MDRYYDTGLKVVQKDDEFFIIREEKMTQGYSIRAKLVTESAHGGLVEREGVYVQSRFEAGDYDVSLGRDYKDNWISPKGGTARIRLDWKELLNFVGAHEPDKPFLAGGFINTPNIMIDVSKVNIAADKISERVRREYGK